MTAPNAAVNAGDLMSQVESMALATGLFSSVAGHEPVNPPQLGLTAGLFLSDIGPAKGLSGLVATAARLVFTLRIILPTSGDDPAQLDSIDPSIATATAIVIGAVSAAFTLGGEVFEADLLGRYGAALAGKAGWARIGEQMIRVMDITIPLILDNVWQQAP
jgi:hypothetical protein